MQIIMKIFHHHQLVTSVTGGIQGQSERSYKRSTRKVTVSRDKG